VAAGEDKRAVHFRLPDTSKHSVSGRITFLETGQPVAKMAIRMDPNFPGFGMRAQTQSAADGTFRLEGLTAGGYRMEGRLIVADSPEGSQHGYFLRFFELKAADITNLIIHVDSGRRLKGVLRAAGARLPEKMSVLAFVRNPLGGTGYALHAVAAADGTFEIGGVQPGTCDLAIDGPASGGRAREFFVGVVTVNGRDVSDTGIRVPQGSTPMEVSVTVDFRPGTITGRTLDSADRPIPGANVVLMSVDPRKRLRSPYWRETRSDREGAFRLGSLVPGEYLLMVWPGYRPWAGLDPDAFAILEKHAVRVSVEQSGIVRLNLRLTKEVRDLLDAL
jgi:Carboxypeptidase regulatory-like domain